MKVLTNLLKATFLLFGSIVLAQDTTEQRTQLFNTIDADGNEVITNREMRTFYRGKLNSFGQPVDAKRLFYAFDANRNSIITLNEYIKGPNFKLATEYRERWQFPERYQEEVSEEEALNEKEKAIVKFGKIDTNKDGKVSMNEMISFNSGKIDMVTGELINGKLLFYALDTNDDGAVSMEEIMATPDMKLGLQKLRAIGTAVVTESTEPESTDDDYVNQRISLFFDLDLDKNYKITLEEMENFYEGKTDNQGRPINSKLRFYGLDTNEDGSIELGEFTKKINLTYATQRLKKVEKQ
ncbi:EF-hand domain-containing protein [Winogradskyella alexanderae]|uniref:EF-hand domain-containing protein n=1 Tax=Winogradskyella alexanderae TaxID=2877123 RepID=A0ABS7XS70_9FLAO|nr:EF-hand domain-containing protein [Winogradskyella alexanderae]MCA0132875.1 EF-hand domain-containing protein [Winogradskyella alexanderae]